jgi:hypothetical protein
MVVKVQEHVHIPDRGKDAKHNGQPEQSMGKVGKFHRFFDQLARLIQPFIR